MLCFCSLCSGCLHTYLSEVYIVYAESFLMCAVHILSPLFNPEVRDTEDDNIAVQRNRDELAKELRRDKPRKEIVLSLARQTFQIRRTSVVSEAEDVSVTSLLSDFPELSNKYVVRNAFRYMYLLLWLIMQYSWNRKLTLFLEKRGVIASAVQSWSSKWIPAIKEYANTLSGKIATLVAETQKNGK